MGAHVCTAQLKGFGISFNMSPNVASIVHRLDCFVDISKVQGAERADDSRFLLETTLWLANLEITPVSSDEEKLRSKQMKESGAFCRYASG